MPGHELGFADVSTDESPTHLGPPLTYSTLSEVTLQRPDKLRILSPGDGPASEFYVDGKMMLAFSPKENFVAAANALPTIDASLKTAYDTAAIYFPFTDVLVRVILRPHREPASRIAWVTVVLALPLQGVLAMLGPVL